VIERFRSLTRRRDGDVKVFAYSILADVIIEHARAKAGFVLRVLVDPRRGYDSIVSHSSLQWSAFARQTVGVGR
jgi:hypothetical protein